MVPSPLFGLDSSIDKFGHATKRKRSRKDSVPCLKIDVRRYRRNMYSVIGIRIIQSYKYKESNHEHLKEGGKHNEQIKKAFRYFRINVKECEQLLDSGLVHITII